MGLNYAPNIIATTNLCYMSVSIKQIKTQIRSTAFTWIWIFWGGDGEHAQEFSCHDSMPTERNGKTSHITKPRISLKGEYSKRYLTFKLMFLSLRLCVSLSYFTLLYFTLFYFILFYFILFYFILFYFILFYFILFFK